MGFWVDPDPEGQWQGWWTVFYWAGGSPGRRSSACSSPGSRGRTIREFCLGVLIVPTLITFFWMAVFGGTAIFQQLYGAGNIIDAVNQDISRPLFVVINNLDVGFFAQVITFVAVILIITYFVTSSDSGTLMITTLISMGKEEPPISYRIFWRLGEGAVAIVLLLAGGLKTLQTGPLAAGLPFSIIMFLMMYGMVKAFAVDPLVIEEELEEEAREILSLGVDQPGD
jgi:choline/glycine/proline betaine transport protein